MLRPTRQFALPALFLLLCCAAGCQTDDGPARASVSGKVTKGGAPVAGGHNVIFDPVDASGPVTCEIKADGTYSGEATVGVNKVTILPISAHAEMSSTGVSAESLSILPAQEVTVPAGGGTFDFAAP